MAKEPRKCLRCGCTRAYIAKFQLACYSDAGTFDRHKWS